MSVEPDTSPDRNAAKLGQLGGMRPEAILRLAGITIGGSVFSYVLYFWLFRNQQLSSDPSSWGDFGSYFSGVPGSLLAFLGMWLVAHSLRVSMYDIAATQRWSEKQLADAQTQIQDQRAVTIFNMLDRLEARLARTRGKLEPLLNRTNTQPHGWLTTAQGTTLRDILALVTRTRKLDTLTLTAMDNADLETTLLSIAPARLRQLHKLCLNYQRNDTLYLTVGKRLSTQLATWFEAERRDGIWLLDDDPLRGDVRSLGLILGQLPSGVRSKNNIRYYIGSPSILHKHFGKVNIS
jgi:hypothetical protein